MSEVRVRCPFVEAEGRDESDAERPGAGPDEVHHRRPALWRRALALVLVLLLALPSPAAMAALVIPQLPVLGATAVPYAPNLMILLDNSSSMFMEMMPSSDTGGPWGNGPGSAYNAIGLYSSQCNSLYFDPTQVYAIPPTPIDPSGAVTYPSLPVPTISAAPVDGYAAFLANPANPAQRGYKPSYYHYGLNASNWGQNPQPTVAYDPAATRDLLNQPLSLIVTPQGYQSTPLPGAGYFMFSSDIDPNAKPTVADCLQVISSGPGGNFNPALDGSRVSYYSWIVRDGVHRPYNKWWIWIPLAWLSGEAGDGVKSNFANWYSYYRSRINVMKSALGTSLSGVLTTGLRAGLLTSTTTPIDANNIVTAAESSATPVGAYAFQAPLLLDAAGQATLISRIYGQAIPMNSLTYLLTLLSRAGQYYAGRRAGTIASGGNGTAYTNGMLDTTSRQADPVQASCQRNYSLLVTDGYYNDYAYQRDKDHTTAVYKTSWDTPPGQSVTWGTGTYNTGVNGRAQWPQPFPSPQAWKPFDDSLTETSISCDPALGGATYPGGYDAFQPPAPGSVTPDPRLPATYTAYTLEANGDETVQSANPVVVPRPAIPTTPYPTTFVSATQNWTNNQVVEFWYGTRAFQGWPTGTTVVPSASVKVPGTGPGCAQTDAAGNCIFPVQFNYYTTYQDTTSCPTGESAGNCTTQTSPVNGSYGACTFVRWAKTNDAYSPPVQIVTPVPEPATPYSKYAYRQWPIFTNGCSGLNIEYQIVCSDRVAPNTAGGAPVLFFRVPGLTHDATGAPIRYTYTRTTGRPNTPSVATNYGVSGGLADLAMYYYDNDLRPTMPDNLPIPAAGVSPLTDTNRFQHMTTYAMGLGVSGGVQYAPDYAINPASTSDWSKLLDGSKVWPAWNWISGYAGSTGDARIDDLWHAAVNARGRYYSADNASDVTRGLLDMVGAVVNVPVYGAAAASDQLQLQVNGAPINNFYTVYWPGYWTGDLLVKPGTVDPTQASPIVNGDPVSASASLRTRIRYDSQSGLWCDDRTLLLMGGSRSWDLRWDTPVRGGSGCTAGVAGTSLPASLGSVNLRSALDASTADKGFAGAAPGDLVNWIRGSRGKEVSVPLQPGQVFRYRIDDKSNFMPMGDIVNGQPAYVGPPVFKYTDNDYASFAATNKSRAPRVYLAANDGFLHAFDPDPASGVRETWAMMPSSVAPALYRTASQSYATAHRFMLDGSPIVADVYDSSSQRWRSIVVGGMRGGGSDSGTSGFYAIDVTDPTTNPTPLWEFRRNPSDAACSGGSDVSNPSAGLYEVCQLGYSYGTPVITRLTNGRWVVMLTSGYNNRDGKGHVYIIDAVTGAQVARLDNNWNGQDNGTAPESGLAQINAWIVNPTVDNTARFAYGGDLNGNVWRYDLRAPDSPDSMRPTLLAKLADASGGAQPATTLPELQSSLLGAPIVMVGTGQLFGDADRVSTQVQSFYGLVDRAVTSNALPATLGRSDLVKLAVSGNIVVVSSNAGSTQGYVLDFPGTSAPTGNAAERLVIPPQVIGGNLIFATNAPSNDPCVAGGKSWLYTLNVLTGLPAAGIGMPAVTPLSISAVGLTVYVVGGQPVAQVTGSSDIASTPLAGMIQPFAGRRAAWREVR
jgi:type IV pilus assembly protein PilY1